MPPQGRFRLNLAPILRFVELEKLDLAIPTSGYDHVVLQSEGQDWLRAAAQGRFGLNLAPILRFVELEKLDFAIVTSGCDHVVLQSEGVDSRAAD